MTYWDEPSGFVPQADETVSVLGVLEDTFFAWPAPVPAMMLTLRPFHWSVVHVLLMSWSVLLVCVMTYSDVARSEEHTSELQSRLHLVCRLLLEKKKNKYVLALT